MHRGHTGVARLALRSGASIVPVGLIGTEEIQPIDSRMPRLFRRVTIKFGEPLDLEHYTGRENDQLALRDIADEIMFELQQLTGYEYVDSYATKKAENVPTEPVRLAS
jgi:1-acyl-sn-glycerol-3-phosphate acyltransferase